jgi:hypothetical protein
MGGTGLEPVIAGLSGNTAGNTSQEDRRSLTCRPEFCTCFAGRLDSNQGPTDYENEAWPLGLIVSPRGKRAGGPNADLNAASILGQIALNRQHRWSHSGDPAGWGVMIEVARRQLATS